MRTKHAHLQYLTHFGQLRQGAKSDLLGCFESCLEKERNITQPDTDAVILDGSAIINILKPVTVQKFEECALNVVIPHIHRYLEKSHRVNIVWDQYLENTCSIKSQVRENRGKGIRRRVKASTTLPRNWQQFLRAADNKKELCFSQQVYFTSSNSIRDSFNRWLFSCLCPSKQHYEFSIS